METEEKLGHYANSEEIYIKQYKLKLGTSHVALNMF